MRLRILILGLSCVAGASPQTSVVRDNNMFLSDGAYDTLALGCTAAANTKKTLAITQTWAAVPTQTCAASLTFSGGSIRPARAAVVTLSGSVEAKPAQIFDYSAGGKVKLTGPLLSVSPLWWGPGLDLGGQINAAIAALAPYGGRIAVPNGSYSIATGIDADDSRGITLEGGGVPTGGGQSAVYLVWTPNSGTVVSARSTASFRMAGIQIVANHPSWAGKWVDFSHSTRPIDSFNGRIEHCGFFAVNGASASVGIDLSKANSSFLDHNMFGGKFAVAVRGVVNASDYSNSAVLRENHFSNSTGSSTNTHILNPGQAWVIQANVFEMGTAAGGKKAIDCDNAGTATRGVSIIGNWTGDWTGGVSGGVLIRACGTGWQITGNQLAGPPSGTVRILDLADHTNGVTVFGNSFVIASGSTSYTFGAGVGNFHAQSNSYSDSTLFLRGTPASGSVEDAAGVVTTYGGGSSSAPAGAHYLTTRAEPGLSAEANLGGGSTGLLKCTVSGGVCTPSAATPGTDYAAPNATTTVNGQPCALGGSCTIAAGGSTFSGSTASASRFSATPTFSLAELSAKSPTRFEPGPLIANVTAVTFTNKSAGAKFSIAWRQDGAGGRTVAYGAAAANPCRLLPTANKITTQFFEVAADGTSVVGVGCVTDGGGEDYSPTMAAPATPASGNLICWNDSTDQTRECKDSSGAVYKMLRTLPVSAPFAGTNASNQIVLFSPFATNPKTAAYQVQPADFAGYKTIVVASGTFTITLVARANQPPEGQFVRVINYGTGVVTIARSGQNINGGTASLTLPAGTATAPASAMVLSDATHYFALLSGVNASTVTGFSPIAGKTLTLNNSITATATDGATVAFGAGGTASYTVASGASALGTSPIAPGACATAVTTTATGAVSTDVIMWSPNASIKAVPGYAPSQGGLSIAGYPTANAVNWDVCNGTSRSITPGAVTLNWKIIR